MSEAQNPISPHILHTVYVYALQQTYSHRAGGRGVEPERRLEGQQLNSSQSWVENTNMTDYISSL